MINCVQTCCIYLFIYTIKYVQIKLRTFSRYSFYLKKRKKERESHDHSNLMLIYACADYHMYPFNLHLFAIIKINLLHHKTFLVRILWLKSLSFLHYSNEAVLLKYLLLAGVNSQARRLGIVSSSPGKLLEDLYST